jgi:hypothetical protein
MHLSEEQCAITALFSIAVGKQTHCRFGHSHALKRAVDSKRKYRQILRGETVNEHRKEELDQHLEDHQESQYCQG